MVGTGYLLWTPETVMQTPMPMIELALKGHVKYLRLVNGQPEEETPADAASQPVDALGDYLRRRARGHNG